MNSQGIIIRFIGARRLKAIVLDYQHGMIELILLPSHYLHEGYCFNYTSVQHNEISYLQDSSIIIIPSFLITFDIAFLHQILEVIYYFVPLGSCTQHITHFMHQIYAYGEQHNDIQDDHKRFFLIKLFYILGFPHDVDPSLSVFLYEILKIPVDRFHQKVLDLSERKKVDSWLKLCIQFHPESKLFMTFKN